MTSATRSASCLDAALSAGVSFGEICDERAPCQVQSGRTGVKNGTALTGSTITASVHIAGMKTLHAIGPVHGYGIARRLEQISDDVLQLNQGTIYASLARLLQRGWILAAWGASENNRKARFYSITKTGRKQLTAETENWKRIAGVIGRVLRLEERS